MICRNSEKGCRRRTWPPPPRHRNACPAATRAIQPKLDVVGDQVREDVLGRGPGPVVPDMFPIQSSLQGGPLASEWAALQPYRSCASTRPPLVTALEARNTDIPPSQIP